MESARMKIKMLPKYQPEKRTEIYLALNENPFDFPKEILDYAYKKLDLSALKIYYDSPCEKLLQALSQYTSQPKERISIGNGADEIIYYIFLMFKTFSFYICPPTYSCYSIFACATGVNLSTVPLLGEKYDKLDIDELTKKLDHKSVLFLPNPNNPTGHLFDKSEIEYLLSTGAIIVVDEAYYEFAGDSCVELLDKFKNLIIIRTFSKAFCLAAQRIGYILANEELIDYYNSIRLPYNVSYLSQLLALASLENLGYFKEKITWINQERERMKKTFLENGFHLTDSVANFIFILANNSQIEMIFEKLKNQKVTVRKFKEGVRISIGKSQENDLVKDILIRTIKSNKGGS
ncbi:MAG: aminotransferase class I/II-fold pyridoxal phosphate-dependent enzyme [Fervidobacterium sp.]|nr:aminotransferase class I/II-fold pyridoxal phosphate-dependent enzyme [Fervidobacterium sp.]